MKRRLLSIINLACLYFIVASGIVFSQDFPDKPAPPCLVNDFTGFLNKDEVGALERKLVVFNDSTSTQIAIVIVPDLKGYDKADYAQRLAEKWGIGQKGLNNGILILVKPKTQESPRGDAFIATGYGLGGAIPDIICGEIVDREILPAFRQGEYFKGLDRATTILMSLARGEFSAAQYDKSKKKEAGSVAPVGLIILIIILVSIFHNSGRSNHSNISRSGLPLWILLGMMGSGRGAHNGSWGGFSGGGGGGGGGLGGFGGGGFGGGGAGGSW